MNALTWSLGCWLAGAVLAWSGASVAQDKPAGYPVRPIRLVISGSPGAGGDMMARAVAQMLTDAWGQNAIVDSRPGGSGVIAVELAARSTPDGYTLLSLGDNFMLLGALKRVPFDVLKAFDPVVPTSAQPYVLLANPSMPFKSIQELVAYSATRRVTYSGSSGVGATVHLGMERLAQLSGAKLLFIPYKGTAPGILAAMGGEINMVGASSLSATGRDKNRQGARVGRTESCAHTVDAGPADGCRAGISRVQDHESLRSACARGNPTRDHRSDQSRGERRHAFPADEAKARGRGQLNRPSA